jgi:hypothetical protein
MADKNVDIGLDPSKARATMNAFLTPFKAVTQYVGDSVDTFSKLSATGNAFNNDIVGMKVAAANSRMSLDDLSKMLEKNNGEFGKSFAGIGGSVTKGSQVFTEFSKTFFDSGVAENLRQMGFTSKDLNEVLANQIGFQKSTTDTSVQGQIRTAAAAASLAEEMDLIAKLTGKSRKEQEEQINKAKMDGQIEAKFRLIGIQQGADAEKTARENFAKQLAQSQAMGTDTVFKEMFATGTVRSREASMQMGLLGGAARETANSAKALAKGNAEASQAAMNSAKVFNMENQKSVALLQVAAIGVGEAGAVMKKNIETNDAAFHGLAKTQKAAEAMGKSLSDTKAALDLQRGAIKQEQDARHGATAAMIATTARIEDATAAIANKVVKPLNEGEVSKAALNYANSISQGVKATDTANKTATEYQQALINQAKLGGPGSAPASAREKFEAAGTAAGVDTAVKGIDTAVGGGLQKALELGVKTANFAAEVVNVKNFNANLPSRDAGTMGKTGMPFEPQDLIAQIHKGEMVLTPDQAKKFMEGAKTEGLISAVSEMSKSMPKIELPKGIADAVSSMNKSAPSIDVSKVPGNVDITTALSDVKKSVSSMIPELDRKISSSEQKNPTAFKMPSMDQISFGPDGMPKITAKPQITAMANSAAAERKAQQERQTQQTQPKSSQTQTTSDSPQSKGEPTAAGKAATLDDVVKGLNSLNTTMVQVLRTSSEMNSLVERQVKATKAIGGNVYDRLT